MSTALFESVSRIARHEAGRRAVASVGRVTGVFPAPSGAMPADHAVTVELRDSGLILPRVPVAVGVMGFAAVPALDDLVLVLFLEGDVNAPVVVGRIYHPDQDPPEHDTGDLVLRLPSGQSNPDLNLLVQGEKPSIQLDMPGDVHIEIVKEKVAIQVGKLALTIDGAGGGRAEVAAGNSKITLKQDGDITIKAAGNLKIEGTQVEISGSAKVSVKGGQVEIN